MTRLRAIVHELVERKLWPVAVALVVAAVALPIVLGGGGDKSTPSVPAAQSPVPANGQPAAVVSVTDVTAAGKRNRKGSVRDPFVQQHVPAAASGATTGITSPSAGTTLTPSSPLDSNYGANPVAGDSPGSTTVSPSSPSVSTGTASVYHAVIRTKQLGKVRWLHDVARYDHLPSDKQRYVLFLGVLSDRKTAVFSMMVPGYLYGSIRCRPTRKFCATFEMRVGNTVLMTLPQADGSVKRIRLTLTRIFVKQVKKASAKASASATRRANEPLAASFIK